MTESLGWVVAIVVGVLAVLNRCISKKRDNAVKGPTAPPEQVAASHARDAIKDAAERNMGEVDDAMEGEDVAAKLSELANRAAKRREP